MYKKDLKIKETSHCDIQVDSIFFFAFLQMKLKDQLGCFL